MPIYSFRTTENFRLDVEAPNPKKGYIEAQKKAHKMILDSIGMTEAVAGDTYFNAIDKHNNHFGRVLPEYITYKNGFARADSWKHLNGNKIEVGFDFIKRIES